MSPPPDEGAPTTDLVGRLRAENVRLQRQVEALRALSFQDALTGLKNRRYFDARLREEIDRAARHGAALSLIVADIDDFKAINDALGHGAGDEILIALASFLTDQARDHDVVCRLGGDEVALILPDADPRGCSRAMSRIRATLAARGVRAGARMVSLSMGGASIVGTRCPPDELYAQADRAMYRDKRARQRDLARRQA